MKVGELRVLLTKLPHSADNLEVIINNEAVDAITLTKGRVKEGYSGKWFLPLDHGKDTVLQFTRSVEHSDGLYYQTKF